MVGLVMLAVVISATVPLLTTAVPSTLVAIVIITTIGTIFLVIGLNIK